MRDGGKEVEQERKKEREEKKKKNKAVCLWSIHYKEDCAADLWILPVLCAQQLRNLFQLEQKVQLSLLAQKSARVPESRLGTQGLQLSICCFCRTAKNAHVLYLSLGICRGRDLCACRQVYTQGRQRGCGYSREIQWYSNSGSRCIAGDDFE